VKYDDALVPTTAPTVIFAYERVSVSGATIEHCTVVCDDHDTVEHKSTPSAEALAVKLYEPKLSPLIVTVDPPLSGPPLATSSSKDVLTTGASKVKEMGPLVPTTAPTVTLVYAGVRLLKDVPIRHCVVVADVHAEVLHSASRIAASVGVKP
jgi:hypothetical protein